MQINLVLTSSTTTTCSSTVVEHIATIRVSFPQIDRTVQADLFTREAHKDYRPFYAKGRVRPGMQTRPFGFVEDAPQPMNVEEQPPPPPPARRKRTLIEAYPNQPGHSRWF
ncbi:hypothetical protein niasHT_012426 [Heterodera trifolii]|uniref:Uncharacterized protein n=1 Tax=Heterodera trifolii TaxID=157864 RepID=A0ABD2LAU2_9BILA